MPAKRSRLKTEEKFKHAVIELLAESGCANLGINVVAQRAGADKVLIYRYFGGMEGLLQQVAESRDWLPSADELLHSVSREPAQIMRELSQLISRHIRMHAATRSLLQWRHAERNPLTTRFTEEWQSLWSGLETLLSAGLGDDQRHQWEHALALLALTVQAGINEEAPPSQALDKLYSELELGDFRDAPPDEEDDEDQLPTNLL